MATNNGKQLKKKTTIKEDEAVKSTVEEATEVEVDVNAVEAETSKPEETAKEPVKTKSTENLVQICLSKDHSCFIGGKFWRFEKGKTYDVPANVKAVLRRGDLLRPVD